MKSRAAAKVRRDRENESRRPGAQQATEGTGTPMPDTQQQITRTEAETLAAMLHNAGHHMARARKPLWDRTADSDPYVWPMNADDDPFREMCAAFYDIAPLEVHGVTI